MLRSAEIKQEPEPDITVVFRVAATRHPMQLIGALIEFSNMLGGLGIRIQQFRLEPSVEVTKQLVVFEGSMIDGDYHSARLGALPNLPREVRISWGKQYREGNADRVSELEAARKGN